MSLLNLKELPHRRLEAWKWSDVQGRVSEDQKGLSVAALPHFDLPEGVNVAEVDSDDLHTDTPMADLARQLGGKVWQIDIEAGQKVSAISIANLTKGFSVWAEAQISQHTLSFGAALSRLETRVAAMGQAVSATLNGAYLLDGKRHCDMTSLIDLTVPNCEIRQSVKGVVTDKARGVFQGKFYVRRPAQHTDGSL